MVQQDLGLTVPTGEAEKQRDPANTIDGMYFALSYRGKRVCIDSGIQSIINPFRGQRADSFTRVAIDSVLAEFLKDYSELWYKCPRTGEFLVLEKVTCSFIRTKPKDMKFAPRQFTEMTLVLSPHYKVPNDQGMGRAPVHER